MAGISNIEAINRRSLHDELVERLRDILVEGDLTAGDKIPERELCEQLGVSRTPLREALKVMAADGLITLIPNRGAVLRGITLEEINQLFPVIGAMEALAGELACRNLSDQDIAALQSMHDEMVGRYQDDDLPGYFHLNQQIHQTIFAKADNAVLSEQYYILSNRLRRARYQANMSDSRWAQAVAEHGDMMLALKSRDGGLLGRILKSHLEKKHQAIASKLKPRSPTG